MIQSVLITMVLGFVLCFGSCKTCVPIVEVRDSIRTIEVRVRDTAIVTKADSASLHALLRCDSAYNVVMDELTLLQGWHIQASTHTQRQSNGGLLVTFDCKEDSLVNEIQLRDSIINEMTSTTKVVQVEVVPKFYRGCTIAFWILIVLIVIGIAIRFVIKFYFHK